MSWTPKRASFALLTLCCLGPQAAALQDPDNEEENAPIVLPGMVDQAQEEMLQLFRDIEQNLRKVDVLLSDAGAGDTRGLAEVEESGIGRLLEDTRDRSEQVLQDIDRLLEIAEEMGQQSGGGSGQSGQPQSQQNGSSGSQGSNSPPTRRENTPETPGEEPSGQSPEDGEQPNGEQPGNEQQQPTPHGEQPTDGQDPANTDPSLRPGDKPPTDPTGAGSPNDPTSDRWGDLPVHVQDVFRGEDSEEMPPRYREWIDAYYRRLNRRGGR
jgi:hypothetical protein